MTEPVARSATDLQDEAAWFEAALVAQVPALYGAARRLARHEADAEDLVAEAVSRAWLSRDKLRDRAAFRGWLFRILTNLFLTECRLREARGPVQPLPDEDAVDPSTCFSLFERLHQPFLLWWSNPEQEFLDRLLREDLERALDSLPEPFRVVVVLVELQGFSYQEVAGMLSVPVGTVRSRLARGRGRLQEALWEYARTPARPPGPADSSTERP